MVRPRTRALPGERDSAVRQRRLIRGLPGADRRDQGVGLCFVIAPTARLAFTVLARGLAVANAVGVESPLPTPDFARVTRERATCRPSHDSEQSDSRSLSR